MANKIESHTLVRDGEIDLRLVWEVLWEGRKVVVISVVLLLIISGWFAISLPNKYSSTVFVAVASESTGGLDGLASQYGGLAAIAGVSLGGGESSRADQALALITSQVFLEKVIAKHNWRHHIVAVKEWDADARELVFDGSIYDQDKMSWVKKDGSSAGGEPSSWETYKIFRSLVNVSKDKATGLISITISHYSPVVAENWVGTLVKEINSYFQHKDMMATKANIEFLKQRVEGTGVAEMKSVFYRMIEEQTKKLMLAEVSDEYLFEIVVPALVAEEKDSPNRSVIMVVGVVLGMGGGIVIAFVLRAARRSR